MCPRTHRASCSMCPPPGGQMSLPVLVSEVLGGRTWFVCGGGRADVGVPTCPCRYVLGEGSRSGDPWRMGRGRERPTWLPRQRGAEEGTGQTGCTCRGRERPTWLPMQREQPGISVRAPTCVNPTDAKRSVAKRPGADQVPRGELVAQVLSSLSLNPGHIFSLFARQLAGPFFSLSPRTRRSFLLSP